MTFRTWLIQLLGLLLLIVLLMTLLPVYTPAITQRLAQSVQQTLHKQGLNWTTVQANNRDIVIKGNAPDLDTHRKALQIARSIWFVRHIQDDITPKMVKPFTMSINWDGKQLSLKGNLSSKKDKQAIIQQVKRHFSNHPTSLQLQTAAGAPNQYWDEFIYQLLEPIQALQFASITLIDTAVHIAARAEITKEINAIQQVISKFRQHGYSITTKLVSQDISLPICQEKFNQLLKEEKIQFTQGQADISHNSEQLFEKLADTALLCSHATIKIIGHTDDRGSADANLKLSEKRANAVMAKLFQLGVPLNILKAQGKDSSQPIDTNATEQGRANNRRIEFVVEGN